MHAETPETGTTRRRLFASAGAVGAGALLSACGDGPSAPGRDSRRGARPGQVVAEIDQVDVGGGFINRSARVVVAQPREGEFRAFSAVCTHEGCIVSVIVDQTIVCGCHGSTYSLEDGSVLTAAQGLTVQTQEPLPQVAVEVQGSTIVRS